MASIEKDNFESDWTFVDSDGTIDVKQRKSSVLYYKSPLTSEQPGSSPCSTLAKEDSEGEAEFEVLSGFQFRLLPKRQEGQLHDGEECEVGGADQGDDLLSNQGSSCHCSSEDGIMIISTHLCMEKDAPSGVSGGLVNTADVTMKNPSETRDDNCLLYPSTSLDEMDGWKELPLLSGSGLFSFSSDISGSDEDTSIEQISVDSESQQFIDLSHETDEEMVDSISSMFSLHSKVDEDFDNDKDLLDIGRASEVKTEERKVVTDENEDSMIDDDNDGDDNDGDDDDDDDDDEEEEEADRFLKIDLPTLFVLLGLTTALSFSFGYGLSVYYSNRSFTLPGKIKRPGPSTVSLPFKSDPAECADGQTHEVPGHVTWQLERGRETESEVGNLFDTKALHQKLQQKHFKLVNLHESIKQRLHMSKVMSWYWRLKYAEERSKKEGGDWSKLQEQLQHMEALYLQEKHIADMWRRTNDNLKLKQRFAAPVKLDKYWKDFLKRWKKEKDTPLEKANIIQNGLEESTEFVNKLVVKQMPIVSRDRYAKSCAKGKERESMRDEVWMDFKARWTKDARGQGDNGKSFSENGASGEAKKKSFDMISGYSTQNVKEDSKTKPLLRKTPDCKDRSNKECEDKQDVEVKLVSVFRDAKRSSAFETKKGTGKTEQASDHKCANFEEIFLFDRNPLFPLQLIPSPTPILNGALLSKTNQVSSVESKQTPAQVSKETFLQLTAYPDGTGKVRWFHEDEPVPREGTVQKKRSHLTALEDSRNWPIKSYLDLAKRKCKKDIVEEKKKLVAKKSFAKGNQAKRGLRPELSLFKEKQKVRNLLRIREKKIRKQRVRRPELRKKERQTARYMKKIEKLLLELKTERRRIEKEKSILKRSWDSLKGEKEKFFLENELHSKDIKELEKFMAKVKEEKQRLRKIKGKLKKNLKENMAKAVKNLKQVKITLDLEKKRELYQMRKKISRERKALRQQQNQLKQLKQAAKEEFKTWLSELRKMKSNVKGWKGKERVRYSDQENKMRRGNIEEENRRKKHQDVVIKEQMKYEQEKKRNKGNSEGIVREKYKWTEERETRSNIEHQRREKKRVKQIRQEELRKQLEAVNDWLLHVYEKGPKHDKLYKKTTNAISGAEIDTSDGVEKKRQGIERARETKVKEDTFKTENQQCKREAWRKRRLEERRLKRREARDALRDKKQTKVIKKSALLKISENKAVVGIGNFTFHVDLDKALLKRQAERKDVEQKKGNDIKEDKSKISEELRTRKHLEEKRRVHEETSAKRWGKETSTKGPIFADDTRLMIEEWYQKWLEVKNSNRNFLPKGPITSDEVLRDRKNKRSDTSFGHNDRNQRAKKKVCASRNTLNDYENLGAIPPPNWVFDRAEGRADWRVTPWYERRAEDRTFQKSKDQHETILDPTWLFERARDRADQRINNEPWYYRRAEGRKKQRHENLDSWLIERGRYRRNQREQSTWIPRGPSMDEHRGTH